MLASHSKCPDVVPLSVQLIPIALTINFYVWRRVFVTKYMCTLGMLCSFVELFVLADPIRGGDPGNESVINVPQPGLAGDTTCLRRDRNDCDLHKTPPGKEGEQRARDHRHT